MPLLTYELTFQFARSVRWSNDQQVPQVMEVVVIPLASPSFPDQGTFVGGLQSQSVLLTDQTNSISFNLVPTDAAGLSERVLYRAEWREGGITGRTYSQEFAMPSQNVTWDEIQQLGNFVTGVDYIQQTQIGVAGGIAGLDAQGHVVDAAGTPVAQATDIATLTSLVDTEVANRQTALNALQATFTSALNTDINNLNNTFATNLTNAEAALNAIITSNILQVNNSLQTEGQVRKAADDTLTSSLSSLSTTVAAHTATLPLKADLVGGYLKNSQIPPALILNAYPVANQAGMLALSATQPNGSLPPVHYADVAIHADDGTVWMLLYGSDPSALGNWQPLTSVSKVNGYQGDVTLAARDVGAVGVNGTYGSVTMNQVTGLATALNGLASASALSTLNQTVQGILSNTNYVMLDTSGLSSGHINHNLNDAYMAYVNQYNEVTLKDGTVIASGTGSIDVVNGKSGPNVTLTASDVGAIASGTQLPESQIIGLTNDLAARVLSTDSRLSNARTPLAHAATHSAGSSDPISVAVNQVVGLATQLSQLATETDMSNAQAAIATLQSNVAYLLGGGTPSSSPIKANWYDGTAAFTGITNLADFQNLHNVQLKGPWGQSASDNSFYYNPAGANVNEWQYAYITPNGHLQLREWNESNPPDPAPAYASDVAAINATIATLATSASLSTLSTLVNSKASQASVNALQTSISGLATQASVNALSTAVGNAATQASLNAVSAVASAAAPQSQVTTLANTVATLATQTSVANLSTQLAALQNGQSAKADLVGGTVPLNELPSIPINQISGLATQLSNLAPLVNGLVPVANVPQLTTAKITNLDATLGLKADLVNGTVPTSQLPQLSVNAVFTAANQSAMLALPNVAVGDICVITGTSAQGSYILANTPSSSLSNWVLMPAPANVVQSLNGKTGALTIGYADVGALGVNQAIPINQVTNLSNTLATFATTGALTSAVSGLQSLSQVQALLTSSVAAKQQASYVATSAIPSLAGQQSIDGVLTPLGSIVLATAQPSSINNGLWVVQSGAWIRATDFASGSFFLRGTLATVSSGTANANTFWQQTTQSGVVDTNANNWVMVMRAGGPIVYTQGNGVTISNTNVVSAQVAVGGGLTLTAQGLGTDRSITPGKYAGYVPSGATIATIPHGLNTTDIGSVFIKEVSTGNQVLACPTITGLNTLTIEFAVAPSTNQWRVVVMG